MLRPSLIQELPIKKEYITLLLPYFSIIFASLWIPFKGAIIIVFSFTKFFMFSIASLSPSSFVAIIIKSDLNFVSDGKM